MENNEIVPFYEPCDWSEKVEIWLDRLTDKMRATLHISFRNSVVGYEEKQRKVWTTEVNFAFTKLKEGYNNSMRDHQKKQILQLNSLIELLLCDLTVGDRQK